MAKLIKQTTQKLLPEMAVSTRTSTTECRPVSSSCDNTEEDGQKLIFESKFNIFYFYLL